LTFGYRVARHARNDLDDNCGMARPPFDSDGKMIAAPDIWHDRHNMIEVIASRNMHGSGIL